MILIENGPISNQILYTYFFPRILFTILLRLYFEFILLSPSFILGFILPYAIDHLVGTFLIYCEWIWWYYSYIIQMKARSHRCSYDLKCVCFIVVVVCKLFVQNAWLSVQIMCSYRYANHKCVLMFHIVMTVIMKPFQSLKTYLFFRNKMQTLTILCVCLHST